MIAAGSLPNELPLYTSRDDFNEIDGLEVVAVPDPLA
jgi:hypothetical protein